MNPCRVSLLLLCALSSFAACAGTDEAPFTGAGNDGGADAGSNSYLPARDAGTDEIPTNQEKDSGPVDAGPSLNKLYAIIDSTLVTLDAVTGAVVPVGPTGNNRLPMSWDPEANITRVIVDPLTAPKVGTLDLCSGKVTVGVRLKLGATEVPRIEAFARDPVSGSFYATADTDVGDSSATLSQALLKIDLSKAGSTLVGSFKTMQDDGDSLAFTSEKGYLLDVSTPDNATGFYSLSTTAKATLVKNLDVTVLRMAFDVSRNKLFVAYGGTGGTNRGLATLDPATGAITKVGNAIVDTLYVSHQFNELMAAPAPTCPAK